MPMLNITRVVRDHVRVEPMKGSRTTIGQLIDVRISAAIENGEELQTIAIEFEQEEWHNIRNNLSVVISGK